MTSHPDFPALPDDDPTAPPPPPPAEQHVADAPRGTRRRSRAGLFVGAVLVIAVAAVGGGAVGARIATQNTAVQTPTPTLSADNRPLPASASGDAAAVAAKLSASVGTLVVTTASGSALGSGFVISNTGTTSYLLTNNHVVAGATAVELVMPTDVTYTGTVVGTDTFDDLAVISVQDGHLPVATFGDSTKLITGQAVIAIGSPLGNVGTVTTGVISALHRTIQAGDQSTGSQETLQDVLQTDASINPGNSGGPLADTAGRVVGVNVAASGSASSIGFSIPASIAQRVATALIAHQTIRIPYVGLGYTDPVQAASNGQPYRQPGLKITAVQPGSPAAGAGIQVGDVLTSVDGAALTNGQTLGGVIQSHTVGDTLSLVLIRNGQNVSVSVTLSARPASAG